MSSLAPASSQPDVAFRLLVDDVPGALILVELLARIIVYRVLALWRFDVLGRAAQLCRKITLSRIADHRDDTVHLRVMTGHLDRRDDVGP